MEDIMVVSIYSGNLLTGEITGKVPATSASWSAGHRAAGGLQATVPLVGEILDEYPDLVYNLAPWRCFLAAITDDGVVMQAGPIVPHKYSDTTGVLSLSALGLRGYFARRFLMPPLTRFDRPADAVMEWSGLSLGTLAKRMVQLAMSHTGSGLPIDLPPDEAGTASARYHGFELGRISKRLEEVEDRENGPDIAFEPYLVDRDALDKVRWRMRVGTNAQPMLTQDGPDHVWDRTARKTPIVSLDVDMDSSNMGDRAWVTGQGSDTELLMTRYEDQSLRVPGYPLLEVDESRSNVDNLTDLNAHVRALLRSAARPYQTWTMTVQADQTPKLGAYKVGDWVRVYVGPFHPYIPARTGYYRTRIMDLSGDFSGQVKIVLAPEMENR